MLEVRFFTTPAGRSQPKEFLDSLGEPARSQVFADIQALALEGFRAPIQIRRLHGEHVRGMSEIKTGNYRTFFCVVDSTIWLLHICKKEHQDRGIEAARGRMRLLER